MRKSILYILSLLVVFIAYKVIAIGSFVSVIVPVYNAEKYISRCLDSIISQKGVAEIIVVNDGSTDGTYKIIESYAKKYSKIKIVNQKNQGVSVARNTGIENAKSEYITFVDSDDWLEPKSFKQIVNIIKKDKPEVVLTGFYDVYDREWVKGVHGEEAAKEVEIESKFRNKNLDNLALWSPFYGKEAHSDLFYNGGGVRARFFKNDFIRKNNITFPNGINCYEDDIFLYKTFLNNPKISIVNEPIYNYHNRLDSISKSKDILQCGPKSIDAMQKTFEYKKASRREQMLITDYFVSYLFLGLSNLQRNKVSGINVREDAQKIYDSFSQYNRQELKSCRNYNKLRKLLYPNAVNQGF
jgi:glycosyltransferase involved in cell wall biosynthesis